MARESPGYRDHLESIITAFPKGERLTVADEMCIRDRAHTQ